MGFFFLNLSIFSFGFKSQTIFLNIPQIKNITSSLGYECFALFFIGEALSYSFSEFVVHYIGYRIVLKMTGLIVCIFFCLTLYEDIFFIRIGAFFTGIAFGHMWISLISFLNYSRSHPWHNWISKIFIYTPILVTFLLPVIGISCSLPDKLPLELKSPAMMIENTHFVPEIFENVKNVVLAKIFYEHLIEYLIYSLIGTFLLCVQPRLWKIVGIKVNNGSHLKLTLVDYNNKNDDFSKSINELYKGKRKAIAKTWKADIKSIPFIVFNRFMIIGYVPVLYISAMTAYIGPLLTSGINYGDVERDLDVQSNYLTFLIIFICVGKGTAQYWISILDKEKYNKNRKQKSIILLLTLASFLIISLSDAFLPFGQVDLLYGIIKNKFNFTIKILIIIRLLGIAFLSIASTLSEYYVYGYFEILGKEFGSKVLYLIRIFHGISIAFFVLTFQYVPVYILPLIMSIFVLITGLNFSKAEKYLLKSIYITQGVSQTTITKNE